VQRDLSAAIGILDVDAASGERLAALEQVLGLRAPAERDHRSVLEAQHHVADLVTLARLEQLELQSIGRFVAALTEPDAHHLAKHDSI
jgi:hypothetical protein